MGKFTSEELIIPFLINLLQAYNIRIMLLDLIEYDVSTVIPRENLGWCVPILGRSSVLVA